MSTIGNTTAVSNLRTLSARSVVASTLLGTHPPTLPAAVLVRSCEILGVAGGTARVAMTRMVANGELSVTDGRYSLTGALLERQRRQDEGRVGPVGTGDGRWSMFVVTPTDEPRSAADRAELRSLFQRHRYGSLRDGVWTRPANLTSLHDAQAVFDPHTNHWFAEPSNAVATAAVLWNLRAWESAAKKLGRAMATGLRQLDRGSRESLPTNFALDAAVIRHLQADPFLPIELRRLVQSPLENCNSKRGLARQTARRAQAHRLRAGRMPVDLTPPSIRLSLHTRHATSRQS
jgi:phenylacetic acid degradation operon negative regulatory protein